MRAPSSIECLRCEVIEHLAGSLPPALRPPAPPTTRAVSTAFACMLVAAVLWGSSFYFIHLALGGFDAVTITFSRCVIGAAVVGGVGWLQSSRRRRVVPASSTAPLLANARVVRSVVLAGVCTAAALLGVAIAQGTVTSSVAGIVLGTVPVWVAALVALRAWSRHASARTSPALLCALALGTCAGIVPALGAEAAATAFGVMVLLGAALAHAGSMVSVAAGVAQLGPVRNTALVMLVAAVVLAPALLVGTRSVHPDAAAALALIEIGLLPTGLAYIAFFHAVAVLGASRATVSIYLVPVVALLAGTLVGGEPLPIGAMGGAALAMAAVALTVVDTRRESRAPTALTARS